MMSRPQLPNAAPVSQEGQNDVKPGPVHHHFRVKWIRTGKMGYSLFGSFIPDFQAFKDGQEISFDVGSQVLRVINEASENCEDRIGSSSS